MKACKIFNLYLHFILQKQKEQTRFFYKLNKISFTEW